MNCTIKHGLYVRLWAGLQFFNTLFSLSLQTLRFVDLVGRSFSLTATSTSHTVGPGTPLRGSVGCTAPTWPASCHRRSNCSSTVSLWGGVWTASLAPIITLSIVFRGSARSCGFGSFRSCFTRPVRQQTKQKCSLNLKKKFWFLATAVWMAVSVCQFTTLI